MDLDESVKPTAYQNTNYTHLYFVKLKLVTDDNIFF